MSVKIRTFATRHQWMAALVILTSSLTFATLGLSEERQAPPPASAVSSNQTSSPPASTAPSSVSSTTKITLELGEVKNLPVNGVTRVAIAKPNVLDTSILSSHEILIQAKAAGTTTLIVWDQTGQRTWDIEVIDRGPMEEEVHLQELLGQLTLPRVRVKREQGSLFLVGEVAHKEDLDRLEQMLSAFHGVTNLVNLPATPAPETAGPLVELAVQIVETSRKDAEQLGVKWSNSLAFSEAPLTDQTTTEALFHWGTNIMRPSLSVTLNALVSKNKARILSEPKLVTTSGKAASSQIGVDVPIITSTSTSSAGTNQTQVEFRKTGVILHMTPTAKADDPERKITIQMEAELSAIDNSVALQLQAGPVPGFSVRNTKTEVTTTSGQSIVIAGLLESKDSKIVDQVPGFGSFPVLGRLFRNPSVEESQREIVIVLTPTLLVEKDLTTDKTLALERSLAVAEVTASREDPRLQYVLKVQERILNALRYPKDDTSLKAGGRVTLKLHLLADGSLEQATVVESSGIESLDLEALEAARSQSPYPMFPQQVTERDLWLKLPVIFHSS